MNIISLFMCYVLLFCPVLALHPRKQSIVAKHGFWHIYLIYVCVGVSQNEVSFFPRKATVLEPKKDTSCWDIPRWVCVCVHIYIYVCKTYIFLTCVFFYPVLVCPIPKILYFFCMWFDSLIVSEKNCIKPKHAPLKVTISK